MDSQGRGGDQDLMEEEGGDPPADAPAEGEDPPAEGDAPAEGEDPPML